ncbi:MAG: hypothetical protein E6K77_08935 [Candidatus Eisenbacteria bacterium]|uniref:GWxTD domain-containing protein n=1 Tax=Eiseniibacteriota bacterium TaxID=2212470 RepID=A0A538TE67_UNCEI|nr:MAG: hypothetical protein E6K77_08935 [Candidatus Eisenbacteria bacterium]
MGARVRVFVTVAWIALAGGGAPASAAADRTDRSVPTDSSTWIDHDALPMPEPRVRKVSLYSYMFRQAIVEPISKTFDVPDKIIWLMKPFGVELEQPSANENAFDEVANSSWFTNRNHMRAVSMREIREGPFGGVMPAKPWTVTDLKKGGYNPGFQIKDADGRKWIVKLDLPGSAQAGSGAGTVSSRLVWAAGYNISLDQTVTFRREDLHLRTALAKAGSKEPITEEDLAGILARGAHASDGRYYGGASLFLPGKPVGPVDLRGKRRDDPNDWYQHKNRRELRGLYVFYSWLNNWDVKDHQSLDMYAKRADGSGHVTHYLLDVNGSLGAAAEGAKPLLYGYEKRVSFGWTAKRLLTLGFVVEPWRRAHQETGIPSVGNFESKFFHPDHWEPLEQVAPFREMTLRDCYWGAKLVASFSDAQIAAAIDAAGYEDPRAPAYLLRTLIERRDKVARYWFNRVVPLDFFHVEGGVLRFHDLARDIGWTGAREYVAELRTPGRPGKTSDPQRLATTELRLPEQGEAGLEITLSIAGSGAQPVRVELKRLDSGWVVTRVRHAR